MRQLTKDNYLGNPNLKKVGVTQQMSEHEVNEFIKCKVDPIYFAEKYVKIITLDSGFVTINLYPFQKEAILDIHNNRFVIVKAGRQVGKALDIKTPILTPDGWTTMGDLKVGDRIYGTDGNPTEVTFATDIMHDHECYSVLFDNGERITADAEHLWNISYKGEMKTLNTKELVGLLELAKRNKQGISIPVSDSVSFDKKELQIHPYLFGLWLGDGNKNDGRITCSKEDYYHYKNKLTSLGYEISELRLDKRTNNCGNFNVYGLMSILRKIGVLKNKHIPHEYMFSNIDDRLELIRGLMDSDGYSSSSNGVCDFYQKDENLLNDVRFILSSLGIKTRKSTKTVDNELYHILRCSTNKYALFSLERKLSNQNIIEGNYQIKNHYIVSIEKTNSVPVRCIQVSAENHLFLCGHTLIPTHNTTTVVAYILWYILFNEDKFVAILANKAKTSREILNRIKLAYEALPLWLQQGISAWNKGDIALENNCRVLADSTASSAARGYSINFLYLDEFAFVPNNVAEEFFTSVYPTITSGTQSKVLISSTPNGMNHFYRMWKEAEEKVNGFVTIEANWRQVPNRTEEWAAEQKRVLGEQKYLQEMECVRGDTVVAVRNKETGLIENITITELYNRV